MRSVLVICTLSAVLISVKTEEDLCTTPRQKPGTCILLNKCDSLYRLLLKQPVLQRDTDYLRQSHCGFVGTEPKVCCPVEYESGQTSTRPPNRYPNHNNNENEYGGEKGSVQVTNRLLPGLDECGINGESRILGGEKADLTEFPWMALIEYERPNRNRGFYCGGVLISKRYVLTAAHCLKGKDIPKNWKLVSVRLGEYNTETDLDCYGKTNQCAPPPINIPVQERIAHEDYDPYDINQPNDIALLRLVKNINNFNDYVRPICLPSHNQLRSKSYNGKRLTVSGWGKTENGTNSPIKLKLDVPVKSNSECYNTYKIANINLNNKQMCAGGEKDRDSCRGDSGGPLMTIDAEPGSPSGNNWYAIGVVSFGPSPCGMKDWPGIYTKVSEYIDWINSKIEP